MSKLADYTNDDRAVDVQAALETFADSIGESGGDLETIAFDFLASFCHFCDRHALKMDDLLRRAKMHYEDETEFEGKQLVFLS